MELSPPSRSVSLCKLDKIAKSALSKVLHPSHAHTACPPQNIEAMTAESLSLAALIAVQAGSIEKSENISYSQSPNCRHLQISKIISPTRAAIIALRYL